MTNGDFLIHSFNSIDACEGNFHGLTKREYFAGLAMQGLLAGDAKYSGRTNDRSALADDAIAHADALIAELNKEVKPC